MFIKKTLIVLVVLGVLFLLIVYPKVYVVRASAGARLYWSANEALVFTISANSGARMSYMRYAIDPLVEVLGGARRPDSEGCSESVVIRITNKDVERHETDLYKHEDPSDCGMISAVYQGQIYWGYLAQDSIWRWSGDGFDPVTPEELRALHGGKAAGRSDSFPLGFDNIDGRSMRALSQIRPEYKLTLDGQTVTMIFRGDTLPPTPLSLEVIRPGQGPQTIWSFDERPRRVSKEEYERDFQKP